MNELYFSCLSDAEIKINDILTITKSLNKCFENFNDLIALTRSKTSDNYIARELEDYNDILNYHTSNIFKCSNDIIRSIRTTIQETAKTDQGSGADPRKILENDAPDPALDVFSRCQVQKQEPDQSEDPQQIGSLTGTDHRSDVQEDAPDPE